ncbi:MAG: hypothetical protein QXX51_06620 [Candidatus Bathyarchaeia archaeon]
MPRIKRAINYIEALCSSKEKAKRILGEELKQHYDKWSTTLNLQDFLHFLETIKENKDKIGVPQFFGKFRAYAFEEYVYRLINKRVAIPKNLQTFWGEKCIVWREGKNEYAMEFDVSIGKKLNDFVEPKMVFEAKVELDAARLKTALASFAFLKQWNPKAKCVLVYLIRDFDIVLIKLAERWTDGVFQFDMDNKASSNLVNFVNKRLSEY